MEAALHLCDKFDIEPTGTRDGPACKIGAILCGDENADLRKHYVTVQSKRHRLERDVRKEVKKSEQLEAEELERLEQSNTPPSAWQTPLVHEVSMWTRDGQYLFVSPSWATPQQEGWHRVLGDNCEYPARHSRVTLVFPQGAVCFSTSSFLSFPCFPCFSCFPSFRPASDKEIKGRRPGRHGRVQSQAASRAGQGRAAAGDEAREKA
jgi:hypothetical protein